MKIGGAKRNKRLSDLGRFRRSILITIKVPDQGDFKSTKRRNVFDKRKGKWRPKLALIRPATKTDRERVEHADGKFLVLDAEILVGLGKNAHSI